MSTSKIHINKLAETLKGYRAEQHKDVSTDKGVVFFSRPLGKWILVRRQGDTAILTFSTDCPCKDMGVKY